MTTQCSDQLTNFCAEISFEKLRLNQVCVGSLSNYGEKTSYEFKIKPEKAPGYTNSSCWRGYVAYYELSKLGTLRLIKYQDLSGRDQPVNEILSGDFWLQMSNVGEYEYLYVPFVNGKIVTDKKRWLRNPEVAGTKREFVHGRKIDHLVHFTRLENLPGILTHGLIGRNDLLSEGLSHSINDSYRFDNVPNAVCLSISFPNFKMFYSYRQPNPDIDWVVIRLKPDILWEKDCHYCERNAAEKQIAQQPIHEKTSFKGLERMFLNRDGYPSRETTRISAEYTTHPQAEVLVLERIETKYIIDILVDKEENLKDFAAIKKIAIENAERFKFLYGGQYFYPRSDYAHW